MKKVKGFLDDEMPREKLIKYGVESLNEVELLAILLRTGTKEKNVLELSREILEYYGENSISRIKYEEVIRFKGIEKAKACQIISVFELARRLANKPQNRKRTQINSPDSLYDLVRIDFHNLMIEKVMAVYVNSKNMVLKKEFLFEGGLDYSFIDTKLLLKKILNYNASGFFLVHNHPSGDFNPSEEDIYITERIKEICESLKIRFLDHLIVGDGYYSFVDNDLI